jgi:hypothetical protein
MVVLNVEFWEHTMSRIVQKRWLIPDRDRVYRPEEMDSLFADLGCRMLYLGGVVPPARVQHIIRSGLTLGRSPVELDDRAYGRQASASGRGRNRRQWG